MNERDKEMKIITTNAAKNLYFKETYIEWKEESDREGQLVTIYPGKKYQTVLGFGGAFTQAAGYSWAALSESKRQEALNAYFSESGLNYGFCRTHINSCDFSLENYCYVEAGDESLSSFSVECDETYLLPLIRQASEISGRKINLLASPWSPPPFMKTNGEMNHGGKLKPEYRKLWAEYLIRYLLAYKDKGIEIEYISVQNEPKAVQTWDSCIYTPEEERDFALHYLKPALKQAGLDVKILVWDHNKERVYENANIYFAGESDGGGESDGAGELDGIWGLGFHWYSGDHFENLQMVYEDYPEKALIFTEGCVEYSRFDKDNSIQQAEMYAHDMIGNFNHGCSTHIDWNLYLDEKGGPNHVGNYCAAPVMIQTKENSFELQLSYYYIGHLSRFIEPGAVRIGLSKYTDEIDACAFENPDGSLAAVLLNRKDYVVKAALRNGIGTAELELEPHSIVTVVIERCNI